MNKVKKGEAGYIGYNRFSKVIISLILLIIPIGTYIAAFVITGTNKNIISIIAIVACLPACRFIVNAIMFFTIRSIPDDLHSQIEEHRGDLTLAYELYLTTRDKSTLLDAVAICGNNIVGLSTFKKFDRAFLEQHITNTLRAAGYSCNVAVLSDSGKFIERLDSMNIHAESLRSSFRYKPDDRYPDLTGEELILHNLMAVAL
ncbi:MAG: hypothetical protein ACOX71_02085 [Lachnospiraceae bacterium]|jgi:hypothetical protein